MILVIYGTEPSLFSVAEEVCPSASHTDIADMIANLYIILHHDEHTVFKHNTRHCRIQIELCFARVNVNIILQVWTT